MQQGLQVAELGAKREAVGPEVVDAILLIRLASRSQITAEQTGPAVSTHLRTIRDKSSPRATGNHGFRLPSAA